MRKVDGMIKLQNAHEQFELEKTRWQILCTIQPHIKKKLKLQDIAVLEGDKKKIKDAPLSPEKVDNIIEKLKGRPTKQVRIETLLKNG